MQVACKAEAGYVGRGMHAGGDHRLACSAVELGHRFDDWRERGIVQNADLAPRARDARAERLGEVQGIAWLCAFVSHERVGGDGAENAQAVFRFLVVDGMAAHNNGARLDDFFEASAQHLARHVFRQGRIHGDHVERHIGHAAHGKNVGKRVGGGDSPEVVGLIDDRRKEINRQNARDVRRDSPYGSVVGRVEAEHGFGRHRLRNGDVF